MEDKIRKIFENNIKNLRETAYNLSTGKLTDDKELDIVNELREEIAEMIEGLALQNERMLRQLEKKEEE